MRRVYLDHNASTPVHPDVLAAMMPYFSERFGNASSLHGFGREARDGIDVAREKIASFLGVTPEEIVFTSGGTESDNLAVKGVAGAKPGGHIVTTIVDKGKCVGCNACAMVCGAKGAQTHVAAAA